MSMTARRQLRLAAIAALKKVTGVTVASPGDWDTAGTTMPEIKLRCGPDVKVSQGKHLPNFITSVGLEISARVAARTDDAAQDAIEALGQLIEFALLGHVALIKLVSQVSTITTRTSISTAGQLPVASLSIQAEFECFESFDPTEIAPQDYPSWAQLNLHADLINPFDHGADVVRPLVASDTTADALLVPVGESGEYPNPPFPDAVHHAPRTSGPDGRDEGFMQLNFPAP